MFEGTNNFLKCLKKSGIYRPSPVSEHCLCCNAVQKSSKSAWNLQSTRIQVDLRWQAFCSKFKKQDEFWRWVPEKIQFFSTIPLLQKKIPFQKCHINVYLSTNSAQDRVLCVDLLAVVILFNLKLNVLRMWRLEMKSEISKPHWGYFYWNCSTWHWF